MNYCHVTDGVVDAGPGPLPRVYANVSGFDLLPAEQVWAHGFRPFEADPIPAGKVSTGYTDEIQADKVIRHWTLADTPPPAPPTPSLVVTGMLTVDADGGVNGIDTASGLMFGMEWEPGVYQLFFSGMLAPGYVVSQPACKASVALDGTITAQEADHVEITFFNRAPDRVPVRPDAFSLSIIGSWNP